MPQGPIQVTDAIKPVDNTFSASKAAPLQLDLVNTLLTGKGLKSALNKTATAGTLVKATPGRVGKVIVNTAASTIGGVYDSNVAGIGTGTLIFAIPETVGIYDVDFPCNTAISLVVGTGGVVALSYQ